MKPVVAVIKDPAMEIINVLGRSTELNLHELVEAWYVYSSDCKQYVWSDVRNMYDAEYDARACSDASGMYVCMMNLYAMQMLGWFDKSDRKSVV